MIETLLMTLTSFTLHCRAHPATSPDESISSPSHVHSIPFSENRLAYRHIILCGRTLPFLDIFLLSGGDLQL